MRKFVVLCLLFLQQLLFAQNSELANSYFEKGEFEKAVVYYEEFYSKKPFAQANYPRLLVCYQELQQYDKAEKLIKSRIDKYDQYQSLVELGYNYQLQNKSDFAKKQYDLAITKISQNQNTVYSIAREFENKVLLDYAILAYETAIFHNNQLNFDYQLSTLYGQKGQFDKMIDKILDYTEKSPNSLPIVQNMLVRYINDDAQGNFNDQLRKSLLTRVQKNQDILWVQFLSWYFVQQRDYEKAFTQERALFRREGNNINTLLSLAQAATSEGNDKIATEIIDFILLNNQEQQIDIEVTILKNNIILKNAKRYDYELLKNQFTTQIQNFGYSIYSAELILQAAKFDGFQLNNFNDAKLKIDALLKLSLPNLMLAKTKTVLADLYISNEKFNQAIIYYAQAQDDALNNEIGHEAQYKMALSSYFKADFDWAIKQFKVLKQSTSLLIANDALDMYLLINDLSDQDTTKVSLTKFAKADFLKFKQKYTEAKNAYANILIEHNYEKVQDVTLYRLAEVENSLNNTKAAIQNLEKILKAYPESIYRDDAYFLLGTWFEKLNELEKAKDNYEKIILNHQDSIYFVEAQLKYRKLRGDQNIQ